MKLIILIGVISAIVMVWTGSLLALIIALACFGWMMYNDGTEKRIR